MPRPPQFCPSVASGLLERVAVELAEERKSLVAYLEVRHANLLADLRVFLPATTHVPDSGPEVFLPELLQSDKSERQSDKSRRSVGFFIDEQHKDGSVQACSMQAGSFLCPPPELPPKSGDATERREASARQAGPLTEIHSVVSLQNVVAKKSTTRSTSRLAKKAAVTESGERLTRDAVVRRLYTRFGYYAMGEWLSAEKLLACLESLTLETFDPPQLSNLLAVLQTKAIFGETADESVDEHAKPMRIHFADALPLRRSPMQPNLMKDTGIRFGKLVNVLCMDVSDLEQTFDAYIQEQVRLVRDLLLAVDANAMIAELLHLRVDDIAAVLPSPTILDFIEPIIGVVILLNAVLIGLQTVPEIAEHPAMFVADIIITCLFIIEFVAKLYYNGLVKHFSGPEFHWNLFDLMIILLAVMDVALIILRVEFDTSALTIVRMARLTRLARLVRIFRVSWLSELRLLCLGLVEGLRTLFWAVVLLFLIMYVVAVFLTLTIGEEEGDQFFRVNFSTLPRAAFTTFRCLLVVDCNDEIGRPILSVAMDKYGWMAPMFYIFLFITVSIGLMNLIMAIYIEATLSEAKSEKEANKEEHRRQSLHVALQLKKLLMKLSALQSGYHQGMRDASIIEHMSSQDLKSFARVTVDPALEITKEIFMMALQESEFQQIMNDLGIPPERAQLFDAMDVEGNGIIKPKQLLSGLLQVRGESRKSDSAALLLAVRFLQSQFHTLDMRMEEKHNELLDLLTRSTSQAGEAENVQNAIRNSG